MVFEIVLPAPDGERVLHRGRADAFSPVLRPWAWGTERIRSTSLLGETADAGPARRGVSCGPAGSSITGWNSRRNLRTRFEPISHVAMDIVNNCNLRCPFCVYDYANTHNTRFMSEATFESALRLIPYVTDGNFWLSCLHEATLHPTLVTILSSACRRSIAASCSTRPTSPSACRTPISRSSRTPACTTSMSRSRASTRRSTRRCARARVTASSSRTGRRCWRRSPRGQRAAAAALQHHGLSLEPARDPVAGGDAAPGEDGVAGRDPAHLRRAAHPGRVPRRRVPDDGGMGVARRISSRTIRRTRCCCSSRRAASATTAMPARTLPGRRRRLVRSRRPRLRTPGRLYRTQAMLARAMRAGSTGRRV